MVDEAREKPDPDVRRPAPEAVSDRSLLQRFQRGQADASTQLYLRYAKRLRALAAAQSSPELARRVEPEDIVQSVFRTFFRRAAQGHYEIPDGEELWKLLLVIALNKVRALAAHHRSSKRDVRQTVSGDAYDRALEAEPGRDDSALSVLRLVVAELLDDMAPPHRRMIELRIEGYEVAEIAERVDRSKRSVERVLQSFRARLSSLLEKDD